MSALPGSRRPSRLSALPRVPLPSRTRRASHAVASIAASHAVAPVAASSSDGTSDDGNDSDDEVINDRQLLKNSSSKHGGFAAISACTVSS